MKHRFFLSIVLLLLLSGCGFMPADDCSSACREQGYDDGVCRQKTLSAPEGFEAGVACLISESQECSQSGQCRCYCRETEQDSLSLEKNVLSVADALQVSANEEVAVYGVVYELGERYCPCFRLSSGGADVEAWFVSVSEGDGGVENMEGVNNGDRVVVSGVLETPATMRIVAIVKDDDR